VDHRTTATARERSYTGCSLDPKQAASMFTADGTFEMPYLEDLGFQSIYRGQDEISGISQFV